MQCPDLDWDQTCNPVSRSVLGMSRFGLGSNLQSSVPIRTWVADPRIAKKRRIVTPPRLIYTKGYLVRRFPYDYMDDAAANTFSYILGKRDGMNWVGLYPSMYHRNHNMMTARLRYRDAVRRRTGTTSRHSWKSGGTYSRNWSDVFNS